MIDQLHDVLKERMDKLLEGKLYKTPTDGGEPLLRQIECYPQNFPQSSFESNDEEFPYVLLRTTEGVVPEATNEDFAQMKVLIMVGIYDEDVNCQGYRDVLNIIGKITSDLSSQPVMDRFVLDGPMKWVVNDEDIYPFYIGVIESNWNYRNVDLQSNEHV